MKAPRHIAMDPDNSRARFVGKIGDGRQFFAVNCIDDSNSYRQHSEFRALYLFDAGGTLLEAHIKEVKTRSGTMDEFHADLEEMVAEPGKITIERIKIKPFSIERFGLQFGLIVQRPTRSERANGENWLWVSLQPGDSMAFQAPFDSGEYDT